MVKTELTFRQILTWLKIYLVENLFGQNFFSNLSFQPKKFSSDLFLNKRFFDQNIDGLKTLNNLCVGAAVAFCGVLRLFATVVAAFFMAVEYAAEGAAKILLLVRMLTLKRLDFRHENVFDFDQ